jgi:hypothetical protein
VGALFFLLRWDWYRFHKKHGGTRYAECVFLRLVGSVGHVVHFSASRVRNTDALFFMLGLDWYGFHKNHVTTRYAKRVFLRPVGSAGHVVHVGSSGVRNIDAPIFTLGWAGMDSTKSATGHVTPNLCFYMQLDQWVTKCIPASTGRETLIYYFSCSSGNSSDSTKSALGHVMMNLCFCIR